MQIGQDQLDGRHLEFRMHVDRNAAAVVPDRNRAIDVNRDVDPGAVAGEMFVDRIVEHLENHVVQSAFVRVADIHAGPLSNRLQALQVYRSERRRISGLTDSGGVSLAFLIVRIFVVWKGKAVAGIYRENDRRGELIRTTSICAQKHLIFRYKLRGRRLSQYTILWSESFSQTGPKTARFPDLTMPSAAPKLPVTNAIPNPVRSALDLRRTGASRSRRPLHFALAAPARFAPDHLHIFVFPRSERSAPRTIPMRCWRRPTARSPISSRSMSPKCSRHGNTESESFFPSSTCTRTARRLKATSSIGKRTPGFASMRATLIARRKIAR